MEHNHNWHTRTPETHGSFHLYCVKWIFVCAHTICWLSLLIFTFFFIFGCCCCCCWRWCDSFALSLLDKQTNKREWTKTDKLVTGQQKSVSCACSQAKRVNTRTRAYDIRLRDACIIIRVRSECVMTAYAMWACVRASVQSSKLCMTVCSGINHLHHCAHNSQNHRISHTITGTMVMCACACACALIFNEFFISFPLCSLDRFMDDKCAQILPGFPGHNLSLLWNGEMVNAVDVDVVVCSSTLLT